MLLDDDDFILASLRRELLTKPYLGQDGLEVEAFSSPAAALSRAREPDGYFDLLIVDNQMPEMSGIDFLKAFRNVHPDVASIVLSGHVEMQDLMTAINEAHIDFFVPKPWSEYDLKSALWQAIRHYDLRCDNRRLAKQYVERFGLHHQPKRKDTYQVMVVDDDPLILRALERELNNTYMQGSFGIYRLEMSTFTSTSEAFTAAHDGNFDVVISDYAMPEMNGIEFLRMFREARPETVRILISAMADVAVLIAAINQAGVNYFVGKPWSDYELRAAIDRALMHRELELDNRILADMLRLRNKS